MVVFAIVMAVISVLAAAYSIYMARKLKPPGVEEADFDENFIPTPKDGGSIPVVFGSVRIKDAGIVYYGHIGRDAVTKKV